MQNLFLRLFLPLLLALGSWAGANRAFAQTSLSVVAPAHGSVVRSRQVTLKAAATGFTPQWVDFYAGADPNDNFVDVNIGRAHQGTDGTYSLDVTYRGDGPSHIYAFAINGNKNVASPVVTFTVDTSPPAASLVVVEPPPGSVQPRKVTLKAKANGFAPARVTFYEGEDPKDAYVDVYLGNGTRAPDGTYQLEAEFFSNGVKHVYAEADDGQREVHSPVISFMVEGGDSIALPPSQRHTIEVAGGVEQLNDRSTLLFLVKAEPVEGQPSASVRIEIIGPDGTKVDEYELTLPEGETFLEWIPLNAPVQAGSYTARFVYPDTVVALPFTVTTASPLVGAPEVSLFAPPGGSLRAQWSAVTGVKGYRIEIYREEKDSSNGVTRYRFVTQGYTGGQPYWNLPPGSLTAGERYIAFVSALTFNPLSPAPPVEFFTSVGISGWVVGGSSNIGTLTGTEPVVTVQGSDVIVTWTTDVPATSVVNYGLTTEYGFWVNAIKVITTDHRVVIPGLLPGKTYHLQAYSFTAGGAEWRSRDMTVTIPAVTIRLGDINKDGKVNVLDGSLALRMAVGLFRGTEEQKVLGDVNGDRRINVQDAILILQFAVGRISKFPIEP